MNGVWQSEVGARPLSRERGLAINERGRAPRCERGAHSELWMTGVSCGGVQGGGGGESRQQVAPTLMNEDTEHDTHTYTADKHSGATQIDHISYRLEVEHIKTLK